MSFQTDRLPLAVAAFLGCAFVFAFEAAAKDGAANPLAAAVQPFIERGELAGAVMLVADKDRVLASEAVGFADIDAGKPMPADAIFWIASQSKPITASALMMLVDEGKVGLDDPVARHLPEFAAQMVVAEKSADRVVLQKPARLITVRDILCHVSGLPFKSAIEEPTLDLLPLDARVRSYAMTPLETEPGSTYRYSNAGINTAARIIEVVAGMPFEHFLDQRLFAPLGMKDTTFWPSEAQIDRLAQSYRPDKDKTGLVRLDINQLYYPLDDRNRRFAVPAGGLFSTAQDVARFYQMLLNDGEIDGRRYLSADAVSQLTRRQTPEGMKNSYGLGFSVSPDNWGHGGAYSTGTSVDTKSGLVLVWLVQHAGFPGEGKNSQAKFRQAAVAAFSTR